jgi:hypothetical protein
MVLSSEAHRPNSVRLLQQLVHIPLLLELTQILHLLRKHTEKPATPTSECRCAIKVIPVSLTGEL